jgi:predicted O-methyltransferase YrrM
MNWTGGYVADIGYTAGFYRETAPSHMAFAALTIGKSAGRALKPKRILEIGFGQGLGLALLGAANPDIAFEGCDFNPEHVAHARRLIEGAELTNIAVSETSFEEAAARGGDNDLDVIALHGIFSWVARATQDAIVSILRQRLQPDGMAYVSYNCMPGWAPLAPIRQLMVEVKRRNAGRSERHLALALDLIDKLPPGPCRLFRG